DLGYGRLKTCAASEGRTSHTEPQESSDQDCCNGRGGSGIWWSRLRHPRHLPDSSQRGNHYMQQEEGYNDRQECPRAVRTSQRLPHEPRPAENPNGAGAFLAVVVAFLLLH